ncbi:MAG TPA: Smr/MutS family protein [Polyangiaceae bacterium]|nr:Smr/MutS family protein [Polyangiaceae bacterium]
MQALAPEVTAAAAARVAPPPPPKPVKPKGPDGLSFKDLAGNGGVRPIADPGRGVLHEPSPAAPPRPTPPKHRLWVERRDDIVRARALDAAPRWLDDLQSGRMVPRRELDLHRKGAADARQALDEEVARARRDNLSCVLIVCGRGIHSGLDGPVLPDVVIERLSEELSDQILAFCTAPRRWGGEGALIVMLRPPSKEA